MADLGRWLNGQYRIAGAPVDPEPAHPVEGEDEDESDTAKR